MNQVSAQVTNTMGNRHVPHTSGKALLSVLIPVFNEEKTIRELISAVMGVSTDLFSMEVIVVDDGSNDDTRKILDSIPGIKVFAHDKNLGKGVALRTALAHATGDIAIVQDGDLEYDPSDYAEVVGPIIRGEAEIVYGSRRLKKSNVQHSALRFLIGGIALTWLTNLIYPGAQLTDEPTCYKAFRLELLKDMNLQCERFEFCPEVTAKALKRGLKIFEVPISYFPRSINQGKKIGWRDGVEAAWTLLRYRF
jgi:glycosyltransferase involved in cell wall biosynthesis